MNSCVDKMKHWEKFLERFKHLNAHFHGEGDPPDILLEMRPAEDDDDWLYTYRPPGSFEHDLDRVKDEMCREVEKEWQEWNDV